MTLTSTLAPDLNPGPNPNQVASELADQLLPSITTVEIKPDMLNGPDLIAWRSDLRLGAEGDTHMPATLVVLNPGDVETSQPATAPSRRIPASIGLPPGPPPGPPPSLPGPPAGGPPRTPREQGSRAQAQPRSGPRFPRRLVARLGGGRSVEQLEAEQLEAALAASLSAVGAPPAVEMSETSAVEMGGAPAGEMGEHADRAGTSAGVSPTLSSTVAEISRESSEILESYNEPPAAEAAGDGLADDDESDDEHMPLEAHT